MNPSTTSASSSESNVRWLWQAAAILTILGFLWLVGTESGQATVTIQWPVGQTRTFEGDISANMTILDAFNAAALVGNIKFQFEVDDSNKTKIVQLDEYGPDSLEFELKFFINDKAIIVDDLNTVYVRPGDHIKVNIN